MKWEIVIGLEVHAQLNTATKIFSGTSTEYGAAPNTQASIIDLGFPGVLPVLNKEVVKKAIKFGLATNSTIASRSVFARKNYFYPDLPKGYQISQYDLPIVQNGYLDIRLEDGSNKRINILRAHLEEDAGKSLHEDFYGQSGIDLNRAGIPLLEIVSQPELRSAKEAVTYLKTLHTLVKYLDICDGNMQEGSFRCDANVSVRPMGHTKLGTRAEIKNVNSFRFVERAINFEVERQIKILESGGTIVQETRLYDADKNETRTMRQKEEANDYRYFPDPDLLPLIIAPEFIRQVATELPELPKQKVARFIQQYSITAEDAELLAHDKDLAAYFETAVKQCPDNSTMVANWVKVELLGALNKENLDIKAAYISATELGKLLARIQDNTISGKIAKTIFEALWAPNTTATVDSIIADQGLKQVTNTDFIANLIQEILQAYPQQLQDYKNGKTKLFGFFVGKVMEASKGKANPQIVNELLQQYLH